MENILEFSFVYSKDAAKIKGFLDSIPRSIECISYIEIYNKLSKNDYLQSEPSDAVVSTYLMKSLQSSLSKSTVRSIFYVLGDIDSFTIKDIQSYIETLTDKKVHYKLYYTPNPNINKINFLFKETVEFDIDIV
jgi:hypothetical protein